MTRSRFPNAVPSWMAILAVLTLAVAPGCSSSAGKDGSNGKDGSASGAADSAADSSANSSAAPFVTGNTPARGAMRVDAAPKVAVAFSKPMDTAATEAAFHITPAATGTLAWSADLSVLTFSPSVALQYNLVYTVTVSDDAVDTTGKALALPYAFSFTVQPATSLGSGDHYITVLTAFHTRWGWGSNNNGFGEYGNGGVAPPPPWSPDQLDTLSTWATLAAGLAHTVARQLDGTLWAWGDNMFGQLGRSGSAFAPGQIGLATDWVTVAVGADFSLARRTDGTLWAWGHNDSGQLGQGDSAPVIVSTPGQIGTGTGWTAIAAGWTHALALRDDGTLWAWGENHAGQVGNGTTAIAWTPIQIGSGTNWTAIAAGLHYSLAVKADGTLWAWGSNLSGQLGDGTVTERHSPVQVGTETDWVAVAASPGSATHSLGLKSSGVLFAWGANALGQLGDDTTDPRLSPVAVGMDADWATMVAGDAVTLALKTDGTLWAWGRETGYEIGNEPVGGPPPEWHSPGQIALHKPGTVLGP